MDYWRKNLYILWGTQFLAMMGMNLVVPFLPFYVRQLGITDEAELARWSGLIFAGPFFMAFIATPFWGSMGDKYGKKLMVVRAIFGLGASQILIGFAQSPLQLLLFRIVQGAISGFIASTLALVSSSTPKEKTGYALGFLQSATAAGTVLGPFIGGVLADLIGYRAIFFVVAILCFVGGFVVIRFVEERAQPGSEETYFTIRQNISFMLHNKQIRLIAAIIVIAQAAALMIESIFALYIERFATGAQFISTLTGVIFSIAGIFMLGSSPWWGKRNDRVGYKKNLAIALGGTGIAYSLHAFVPSLYLLAPLRALLGFFRGGILHSLFSLTSLHSPENRKSGLIGLASSMAILGNMIGPLLGGLIAGQLGVRAVFAFNSVVLIAMSAIVWYNLVDLPSTGHEFREPDEMS